jgi:hypothetical protein
MALVERIFGSNVETVAAVLAAMRANRADKSVTGCRKRRLSPAARAVNPPNALCVRPTELR